MYDHSPLLKAVMHNTEKYKSKTAIIINGQKVSYSDLKSNIRKSASFLKKIGLNKGDKIILSAHKDVEYLYFYFASHILGITNVIVDATSNENRLRYIEEVIQPKLCFGYRSNKFPFILFSDFDVGQEQEFLDAPMNISQKDIAEILFTTGTTGNPKGVCLSYYNIYSSASNINGYIKNNSDDIELLGLPICHSFGMGRIRCNLIKGGTIVILENFANVRAFINAFEKYQISGFGIVPAAWAYIRKMSGTRIKKYSEQVRYIEIGSASMAQKTKNELLEMFPNTRICMHYGLTEASRACFLEFHDTNHLNSIGKAVCDKVDVKIFDSNGHEVSFGKKGEICVKGNMVMSHYLLERNTESSFFDDYFRTGDYGYMNEDGYVYLLGREKELINVGGKKVSPMEVEDAILALGVGDCVCVPIKDQSGILGEVVGCYILRGSTTMSFEEIHKLLSNKLESFKRPVFYDWIDKIPTTASGKKQRLKVLK